MTTIFTINGFMGDMWQGPQADTGRYLSNQGLNLAFWQPIGYNSSGFPLSGPRERGLAEFRYQLDQHPGPFLVSSWSLGSLLFVDWYKEALAGGKQADRIKDLKGATTFGNPYREAGKWAPKTGVGSVPDPGGAGIGGLEKNMINTPDWWHDYAHRRDLYTCCPSGEIGEDIHTIYHFVLNQWTGAIVDIWDFARDICTSPLNTMWSVLWAVIDAIIFYGGGTKEHVNYDPHPSMNFLAGIARSIK